MIRLPSSFARKLAGRATGKPKGGGFGRTVLPFRERDLQDACLEYLTRVYRKGRWASVQARGNWHKGRPTEAPDPLSEGVPDIIGALMGRAAAIELKRPGEKLRASQVLFGHEWMQAGGLWAVVCSLDGLIETLADFEKQIAEGIKL